MTSTTHTDPPRPRPEITARMPGGPPLLVPAIAFAVLSVVPFALLMAGVAVPALLKCLLPRPLAISGLIIAAIGMLSTATLRTLTLGPTVPVVRSADFSGCSRSASC